MPIKVPGQSSSLPTSANVKFVRSDSSVKTVQVIKRSKNNSDVVVWEKEGLRLNVYVVDAIGRIYKGSEIAKLISRLHIKIKRNNVVKIDSDVPSSAFPNTSMASYSPSCGLLPGDKIQLTVVGKDWIALRQAYLYSFDDSFQSIFNEPVAANYQTSTTTQEVTIGSNICEGPIRLEILLGKFLDYTQLGQGVIQWSPPSWSWSEKTSIRASNNKKSGCAVSGNLRIRFRATQGDTTADLTDNTPSSDGYYQVSTSSSFQYNQWVSYNCYAAPNENFIDWDAVNVYGWSGRMKYGTYYDDSSGENFYAHFGCMPWGWTYDGSPSSGGGGQTT